MKGLLIETETVRGPGREAEAPRRRDCGRPFPLGDLQVSTGVGALPETRPMDHYRSMARRGVKGEHPP